MAREEWDGPTHTSLLCQNRRPWGWATAGPGVRCGEVGIHWANQDSHVCLPTRSDDRGSRSPLPGETTGCWGFQGGSWLRGAESQHSSCKDGREGAWEVTESDGPEMRSPSPPTLSSPNLSSSPIGWESQRASFPPDTPRDKGCLSWTLRLP